MGKEGKLSQKLRFFSFSFSFVIFFVKSSIFEVDLIKSSNSRGQHMSLGIVMEDTLTLSDTQGGDDNDHQE